MFSWWSSTKCVSNGKLLMKGPFEKIWIQPAAGDGGLLAVLFIIGEISGKQNIPIGMDHQKGSLLGSCC